MRQLISLTVGLVWLGNSLPAFAQQASDVAGNVITMEPATRYDDKMLEVVTLLQSGKPAAAVKIFDAVIADYEARHDPAVPYRCTTGEAAKETIAYASKSLNGARFILGSEEWCTALWGKGFALIDLGKSTEAGPYLARSVEMDPMNAHFINEYAEWFKPQRQWQQSYDLFLRAWRTVDHDRKGLHRRVAARALRGMAFNMIELGDLNEAERLYRQSLDYEPEAATKVQNELDYIGDAKRGKKAS